MEQLDIFESKRNRDAGIKQSIDNAVKHIPDWKVKALQFLHKYPNQQFMTEELRVWSHANGLPYPPHGRAWGSVIVTAKKLGIIKHQGYDNVTNPKAHRALASVWVKISDMPSSVAVKTKPGTCPECGYMTNVLEHIINFNCFNCKKPLTFR